MSKFPSPVPRQRFVDADGLPLIAGKLYTYAAGSTTPIVTYTDSTGGSDNTNPVILDVYGEADVWLTLQQQYKFVLTDSNDNLIWTIDNIGYNTIFSEDITWTGNHTFSGTVTMSDVAGSITFSGNIIIDNNLYVTGDLSVDGNVSLNGTVNADEFAAPLFTVLGAGSMYVDTGQLVLATDLNIVLQTDSNGTPRQFNFQEAGYLRLPRDGTNALDAATVGQVSTAITAALAGGGRVPVAIGAVVSNALVSGAVGISSVSHVGTGEYSVVLSAATTSTGKTIAMTTIRNPSPLRNYGAFPSVVDTTHVTVYTGGGNTWSASDQDFNIVVYSLP